MNGFFDRSVVRVDGVALPLAFYTQRNCREPTYVRQDNTLGDFLKNHYGCPVGMLPLFSLYRDESKAISMDAQPIGGQPNPKWHLLDYQRHEVHVVISELDVITVPPKTCLQDAYAMLPQQRQRFLFGEDYYPLHYYARSIFNRTKLDPNILFSYISTSGLGLRFGLFVGDRIMNRAQYGQLCAAYSHRMLQRFDDEGRWRVDPNVFYGENYWWMPANPFIWVNSACESL